jgi:hypothetical protein
MCRSDGELLKACLGPVTRGPASVRGFAYSRLPPLLLLLLCSPHLEAKTLGPLITSLLDVARLLHPGPC